MENIYSKVEEMKGSFFFFFLVYLSPMCISRIDLGRKKEEEEELKRSVELCLLIDIFGYIDLKRRKLILRCQYVTQRYLAVLRL